MAIDLNAIMAQAQLDPSYLAQHGQNTAALKNLILNYGDSSALSPELAAQYGIQPGDTAAAGGNQYGVVQQLMKQLSGDQYGITNNANAHGALFSGANAAMQGHEQQDAAQRSYNAYQTLQGQIANVGQNDTNSLTTAYGNLATQAANDQTLAPPGPNMTPPTATPGQTYLPGGGITGPAAPAASPGPREYIPPATIKPPKLPKIPVGIHAQ